MKKYIKPAIVEVQLENEAILAASTPLSVLSAGNGQDALANDYDDLDWDEE